MPPVAGVYEKSPGWGLIRRVAARCVSARHDAPRVVAPSHGAWSLVLVGDGGGDEDDARDGEERKLAPDGGEHHPPRPVDEARELESDEEQAEQGEEPDPAARRVVVCPEAPPMSMKKAPRGAAYC